MKDNKFRNTQYDTSRENLKFTDSLKYKKVQFVFDGKSNKNKKPEIFNNKVINKITATLKNKK